MMPYRRFLPVLAVAVFVALAGSAARAQQGYSGLVAGAVEEGASSYEEPENLYAADYYNQRVAAQKKGTAAYHAGVKEWRAELKAEREKQRAEIQKDILERHKVAPPAPAIKPTPQQQQLVPSRPRLVAPAAPLPPRGSGQAPAVPAQATTPQRGAPAP